METSFSCPNCGATIEYGGSGRTTKCTYCGTTVEVPSSLWQPAEDARTTSRWKTYVILFLVVTVGIPTCASLVGVAAGVGASLLAAITPFLLQASGH